MQRKAELVGGPFDGEYIRLKREPELVMISAGERMIHEYRLEERYKNGKEYFYTYRSIPIGNKKPNQ